MTSFTARRRVLETGTRSTPDARQMPAISKELIMNASPAFQSRTELKPLPFDPAKLNGLSERLIRSHWENNYGGSVKALVAVKTRLVQAAGDKDLPPYVYNDLKREHLIRT